jgi:hypothetical protein
MRCYDPIERSWVQSLSKTRPDGQHNTVFIDATACFKYTSNMMSFVNCLQGIIQIILDTFLTDFDPFLPLVSFGDSVPYPHGLKSAVYYMNGP